MKRFRCIHSIWVLVQILVDVMTNVMHSGFPTGRSEQTIVMSFYDITRISHAIEGGNYKKRAPPNLRAVIWVFRSVDEPQSLYFSCLGASCGEEHMQNGMCDLFIHMHVPRPFWGTFS